MFSIIHKRITFANVTLVFALMFAMTGGAYAANKYLITSTKQISPKVLEALRGRSGKDGAVGPTGVAGPQGAAGAKGEIGASGSAGQEGSAGQSVTSKQLTNQESACSKQGGSEFTAVSGKTVACDGKEGSPWTAGGTLPSGKTETGAWTTVFTAVTEKETATDAISFTIPLTKAPTPHFIKAGGPATTECPGNAEAPAAAAGSLCIYAGIEANAEEETILSTGNGSAAEGAGTTGAMVFRQSEKTGASYLWGTWAVTAE